MSDTARRHGLRRAMTGAFAAALLVPVLAACGGTTKAAGAGASGEASSSPSTSASPVAKVSVTANIPDKATDVRPNRAVTVTASDGTLRTVQVRTLKGVVVPGKLNAERTAWQASGRLDAGRNYQIRAVAADGAGLAKDFTSAFSTITLAKDEMTYPSVYPTPDSTVGVGMPIMVTFDVPVTDRARFEKHMHVTSTSGQVGSWYWIDGQHAHFRPRAYWRPNSTIKVNLDLKNVSAGNGIYGQLSRAYSVKVARSLVMRVSARSDQMQVIRAGKVQRTLPITTGKPGFTTRSGTKVIVEKDRLHTMNSETIGLDPNGPNGYNIKDVEFAMRLTFSGEFIHAAPWSVGSQGRANVSHGCTGMSTSNAGWLFGQAMIGDPVEYSGTDKQMTLTNGYGDWNLSWAAWQKGSALHGASSPA